MAWKDKSYAGNISSMNSISSLLFLCGGCTATLEGTSLNFPKGEYGT
jgi:hypothetical protein